MQVLAQSFEQHYYEKQIYIYTGGNATAAAGTDAGAGPVV